MGEAVGPGWQSTPTPSSWFRKVHMTPTRSIKIFPGAFIGTLRIDILFFLGVASCEVLQEAILATNGKISPKNKDNTTTGALVEGAVIDNSVLGLKVVLAVRCFEGSN